MIAIGRAHAHIRLDRGNRTNQKYADPAVDRQCR
jgi:hypothetical protein